MSKCPTIVNELIRAHFFNSLNQLLSENQDDNLSLLPYFEKFIVISQYSAEELMSPLNCFLNLFHQGGCDKEFRMKSPDLCTHAIGFSKDSQRNMFREIPFDAIV